MATLQEIKKQVFAIYATQGKTAKSLVNSLVKELTGGEDLRKKSTWQLALDILTADTLPINDPAFDSLYTEILSVPDLDLEAAVDDFIAGISYPLEHEPDQPIVYDEPVKLRLISDKGGIKTWMVA